MVRNGSRDLAVTQRHIARHQRAQPADIAENRIDECHPHRAADGGIAPDTDDPGMNVAVDFRPLPLELGRPVAALDDLATCRDPLGGRRSEEPPCELQPLMRISYAVLRLRRTNATTSRPRSFLTHSTLLDKPTISPTPLSKVS